ncbi:rhodanese-like domain-containing protein [Spiroplasma endosymbiont of Labia minor]|uniref:rhodanese-like domain-containing protein n=1 Tax=Spiroplasma endosymbiont of Labia minor TaxID=3066305 RepID=UPI0030D02EBB
MQFIDRILKFFQWLFKTDGFKENYKTKTKHHLKKIITSKKWNIIDLRNSASYEANHLKNSINISANFFKANYFKHLTRNKKILIINSYYKNNLNIYRLLKQRHFKPYIFTLNYNEIASLPEFDKLTIVNVYN